MLFRWAITAHACCHNNLDLLTLVANGNSFPHQFPFQIEHLEPAALTGAQHPPDDVHCFLSAFAYAAELSYLVNHGLPRKGAKYDR